MNITMKIICGFDNMVWSQCITTTTIELLAAIDYYFHVYLNYFVPHSVKVATTTSTNDISQRQ